MKNFANSTDDHTRASRKWFAALLWRAFPGPSEHEVANKAARALGVSPRTVIFWLRTENSAALQYVTATMMIAGVEMALGSKAARELRNISDHRGRACGERSSVHGGTSEGGSPR